jgi:large subunit ribosomal protein L25
MSDATLSVSRRSEFGKGPARRLRREHKIPAVLYGHGIDPVHLALPGHETALVLKQANVLLTLEIDGGDTQLALPRAAQRDPLKGYIEHVDLVVVRRGEMVVVDVPIETVGEVASGAVLTIEHNTLSIRADAASLPPSIPVDVEGLEAGASISAGAVPLPAGVELAGDPETVVIVAAAPQIEEAPAAAEAGQEQAAGGEWSERAATEGEPA